MKRVRKAAAGALAARIAGVVVPDGFLSLGFFRAAAADDMRRGGGKIDIGRARPTVAGIVVARCSEHDHPGCGGVGRRLLHVLAGLRAPHGLVGTPGNRAHVAAVGRGGPHRGGNVLSPIDPDRRRFAGRHKIRGGGNLDIERDLAIGTVRSGVGSVPGAVDRHIGNARDRLADPAEELVHVRLHPTAAELDDGDDAAAGEAGRPIIGLAQIGNVPRAAVGRRARSGSGAAHLEIGPDVRAPGDVDVGVKRGAKTIAGRGLIASRCIHNVLRV